MRILNQEVEIVRLLRQACRWLEQANQTLDRASDYFPDGCQIVEQERIQALLDENARLLRYANEASGQIRDHFSAPVLSRIQVRFTPYNPKQQGAGTMGAVAGPITLITAGQKATASVLGFDQFGQPFTGPLPAIKFSSDDTASAIVTSTDNGDGTDTVVAVANGVANLTASLTTAEGLALTDTEAITVAIPIVPPPTPVLSSIKVAFAS